MATYLVTGGAGFIGSHLVDALLAAGHSVDILDDLSTGKIQNVPIGANFIEGSVTNGALIHELMNRSDGCFHLAAIASVERSNKEWPEAHRVNMTGMINVLDAASSRKLPIVYASSAAVYGNVASFPISEKTPIQPLSAYGSDKRGCELHAGVGWSVHGIPSIGLRLFNVYGPRQDARSAYSGVISIFADRLAAGQEITIYGEGTQTRDFIYVGDVVQVMTGAMLNAVTGSEIFNVCTGIETSLIQLTNILAEILEVEPRVVFAPPRLGDIERSVGDPTLIEAALDKRTFSSLTEGLRKMLIETANSV